MGTAARAAPGVWAVGDVARQMHPISGQRMRIETWSNAQNQAAAAAKSWLDPAVAAFADAPWYWSDQYGWRLQSVGLPSGTSSGARELLRGDLRAKRFALLQLDGQRLVGACCVNLAKDFAALRKLVGREVQAADAAWTDPAIDLRKLS